MIWHDANTGGPSGTYTTLMALSQVVARLHHALIPHQPQRQLNVLRHTSQHAAADNMWWARTEIYDGDDVFPGRTQSSNKASHIKGVQQDTRCHALHTLMHPSLLESFNTLCKANPTAVASTYSVHDGHALGVDSSQVGILHQQDLQVTHCMSGLIIEAQPSDCARVHLTMECLLLCHFPSNKTLRHAFQTAAT